MRKRLLLGVVLLSLPLIFIMRGLLPDEPAQFTDRHEPQTARPTRSGHAIVSPQVLTTLARQTMPLDVLAARNTIKEQKQRPEAKAEVAQEKEELAPQVVLTDAPEPIKKFSAVMTKGSDLLRKKIPTPAKCSGLRCSWTAFKYTEEDKCAELQKLRESEIESYPVWRRKIGPTPMPQKPRSFYTAPDPFPGPQREKLFEERTQLLDSHPQAKAFLERYGGKGENDLLYKVARCIVLGRLQPDAADLVPAIVTPLLFDGKELRSLLNSLEPIPVLNLVFVWNSEDDSVRKIVNLLTQFPFGVHVINNGHNVGFSTSINMGMLKALELTQKEASMVMGKQSSIILIDEDTGSDLEPGGRALAKEEDHQDHFDTVTTNFYHSLTDQQKANFPYEPLWFFLVNADTAFDKGTLGRFAFYGNEYSPKGYGLFYGHEQEHYAFAVSLVAIRSAGLMDEAIFPAYMEDVDWHWRIRLCGLGQILTGGRIQHIRSVNLRFARSREAQTFHAMHGRTGNNFAYGKAKWGYYGQPNIYDDRPPSGVTRPFNIPSAPLSLWMVDEPHRRCFVTGNGHRNIEGHCWFNGTNLLDYFTHLAMRQIHKRAKEGLPEVEGRKDISLKKLLPSVVLEPRGNLNEPHKRRQIGMEFFIQGVKAHVLDKIPDKESFYARQKILADYPWHTAP